LTKADVRRRLVEGLEKSLLGPLEGPEEEFIKLPTQRYIVGILFPSGTVVAPEQDINNPSEGEDEEDSSPSNNMSLKDELRPSSMGMSFVIDGKVERLSVEIKWATYSQEEKQGPSDRPPFKRHEWMATKSIYVSAAGAEMSECLYQKDDPNSKDFHLVWKTYNEEHGERPISIFLINKETTTDDKGELCKRCIFSPSISVKSEGLAILARERNIVASEDDDLKSLNLLYHDRHEFGTGHGCSVKWGNVKENRCGLLQTTFLPQYFWQPLSFRDDIYSFYMKDMYDPNKKGKTIEALKTLLRDYEKWISETFSDTEKKGFDDSMHDTFDRHDDECKISLTRMAKGIELLENDFVFKAFCFMNEAMFLQRAYSDAATEHRKSGTKFKDPCLTDSTVTTTKHRWRPFQIAFILQAIPGIADSKSDDRKIVDLLWIPTGGGKTEAYLGLAAFTIAYRRLNGKTPEDYAGISVMMRYTLRLLTIQQFQRAAALMCACEVIRDKNKAKWGQIPFQVGLFVGQSTTPNTIGEKNDYTKYNENEWKYHDRSTTANYALEYWKRKLEKPSISNPFQLLYCPWCGEELIRKCYEIDDKTHNLVTHCSREGCSFKRIEIPAITVDENIYSRLPSIVIGTVDKFAMLPFNPHIGMLFGHVERFCPNHGFLCRTDNHSASHRDGVQTRSTKRLLPPDLIIQDELHLINGPLGSMVGIYETTVERLCTREIGNTTVMPKIIASTATIRRAGEQIWNLFARKVKRFPSPGTIFSDSFFVKELRDDDNAKLFVGVFPSGIGQKTIMKRALSCILLDTMELKSAGRPLEDWDEYWTLVSYFNSIRELGSAKTTIEDDVQNDVKATRNILPIKELTSRMDSKDLPDILSKLNITGDKSDAINILACSNMFSVGVDVQRLGLMIMNNQPKSTSEYIQSTGRVGRNKTGLVIVLYNWARPRDQSHFEWFYDYHNRIQSHVEAMTVTPFSEGARERAIHAQYVSMVRILSDGPLARSSDAKNFDSKVRCSPSSRAYEEWLKARMRTITGESTDGLEIEIKNFLDKWVEWVESSSEELSYEKGLYGSNRNYLLRKIDDPVLDEDGGPRILTPTSMRNVEKQVILHKVILKKS
jgi:transcription elongation factor Elf1